MVDLFVWAFGAIFLSLSLLPPAEGFSSYMTTKSGCLIELDTSEVVMNNPIQAAPSWDTADGKVQLIVTTEDGNQVLDTTPGSRDDRRVLVLPDNNALPTTVRVKVQGSVPDGQYVLQIGPMNPDEDSDGDFHGASFENGHCDGHTRYTGRINDDGAILTVNEESQLWAGWAAGHETVKLLPGYYFQSANDKSTSPQQQQQQQQPASAEHSQDWVEFMTTEIGCASVQLSEEPVQVADRQVINNDNNNNHGILQVGETTDQGIAIEWRGQSSREASRDSSRIQSLVVEVSAGGHFATPFHTAQLACAATRVAWPELPPSAETLVVGTVEMMEADTPSVQVRALYSVVDEPTVLYSTSTLTVKRPEQRIDPQKELERIMTAKKDLTDLHGQITAHRTKIEEQRNKPHRPRTQDDDTGHLRNEGDRSGGLGAIDQKFKEIDNQRHSKMGLDDNNKNTAARHRPVRADDELAMEHMREGGRHGLDHIQKKMSDKTMKDRRREHLNHMDAFQPGVGTQKLDYHHPMGILMHDKESPTVSFDAAYFGALAFFVGSTVATIQICRFASTRGSKGRRDL